MGVIREGASYRPGGTYSPPCRQLSVFTILLILFGGSSLSSCAGASPRERSGPLPAVGTLAASSIMTDRAVLNGTVNPNGSAAVAWFEIGNDPDPSSWSRKPVQAKGTGTAPLPFRRAVRGLNPYTTYYYRAAARNDFGVSRGEIRAFPTGEYYVAVGDSITAGSSGSGFASRLSNLLTEGTGYPNVVANLGISGTTTSIGSKTIPFALSTYPWATYYLMMFGTNDAFFPRPVPSGKGRRPGDPGYRSSYKEGLRTIIAAVRAGGKIPCLAKVPFATRSSIDLGSIREYNEVIDELVAEERLTVPPPDFFAYFQAHPGDLTDGIHPNLAGYEAMAELWFRALNGSRHAQ